MPSALRLLLDRLTLHCRHPVACPKPKGLRCSAEASGQLAVPGGACGRGKAVRHPQTGSLGSLQEGVFRYRRDWATSMPSLSNSPWIGRSPERVLKAHSSDQVANLLIDPRSATERAGLPSPVSGKPIFGASARPSRAGRWLWRPGCEESGDKAKRTEPRLERGRFVWPTTAPREVRGCAEAHPSTAIWL
jgi:hypothetical protein